MKKIRILSLAMVCSMLFCTPIMAAEITTTEDAVIENNPEVVTESLESVKLEEMSPMSLSKEQYDVLSDDEIQTYGMILSILVDTFISKISFPMQPGPEIGSISDA